MAETVRILVNGARRSRRRGAGSCSACHQKLWWCATEAGKPIPFDEVPDVINQEGDVEVVSTALVHWRTCPEAKSFRKPAAEQGRMEF